MSQTAVVERHRHGSTTGDCVGREFRTDAPDGAVDLDGEIIDAEMMPELPLEESYDQLELASLGAERRGIGPC